MEEKNIKTTSLNLPAELMAEMKRHCEAAGIKQIDFLTAAVRNQLDREYLEARGGKIVKIENSADFSGISRADALELMAALAALEIDIKLGYKSGIYEAADHVLWKLIEKYQLEDFFCLNELKED